MKTLIHICCAPCLIGPLGALRGEGIEVAGWFYNPNVHPLLEFRKRIKAVRVFLERDALPVEIDETYGLEKFIREIYNADPKARCEACHRVRLRATAAKAREGGFEAFTTTLLGSPHREHEMVRRLGEEAAREAGVGFLYRDFRPLHDAGHEEARRRQIYLQSYCGCCMSEWERFRDTNREVYRGGTENDRNHCRACAAIGRLRHAEDGDDRNRGRLRHTDNNGTEHSRGRLCYTSNGGTNAECGRAGGEGGMKNGGRRSGEGA